MINFPIPHTARFISTGNIFAAQFNNPTVGEYDFNIPVNTNVKILDLQKNSVYLLERITIGGNVSEAIFNNSIIGIPSLTFKTKSTGMIIYEQPLKILGYYQNQDISTFIRSEMSNDEILCTISGRFIQTADTIGLIEMRIGMALSFFAIDNNDYNKAIRNILDKEYSQRLVR